MSDFDFYNARLEYDPYAKNGVFCWRVATGRVKKGDETGKTLVNGYRAIRINGTTQYAARVAWLLFYGEWPAHPIRFLGGNVSNCEIANLVSLPRRYTIPPFVYWDIERRQWKACANTGGRLKFVGFYDDMAEVVEALAEYHKPAAAAPARVVQLDLTASIPDELRSGNRAGCKGVYWHEPTKQWRARPSHSGCLADLGYFDDKAEAIAAVIKFRSEHEKQK